MSRNHIDTLELPPGLVLLAYGIKFVGFLAVFLFLSFFWGKYLLMDISDIMMPLRFDGVLVMWPMLAWAGLFGILTLVRVGRDYDESRPVLFGRAVWVSLNAGIWEELIYRWLLFFIAMITIPFFNFLFFGFAGFGVIEWVNTAILIPFTNWITFGALAPQLLASNCVLGASIVSAAANFRDGHRDLGWFGWLNAWFCGMALFWVMFHYGIATAIVVHVLYDLIVLGTRALKAR